jgi:hypothetical protein
MLLHKECLPAQLAEPLEQTVIAATFKDCSGVALTPGTKLAKCSDIPAAAAPQQLSIAGNVVSLTNGGSVTLPTTAAPVPQVLSVSGHTVSLSGGGGSVTLPDSDAQTLSISGQTLTIAGGNSVTLPAGATQDPYATPAQTVAGTATNLIVNPADLVARENIPAQTGLGLVLSAIPAPAANQSPWGVNTLGEILHYAPGLGWKIVDNRYGSTTSLTAPYTPPPATAVALPGLTFTMPRAGKASFSASLLIVGTFYLGAIYLMKNGVSFARLGSVGSASPAEGDWVGAAGDISGSEVDVTVAAGDVFSVSGQIVWVSGAGAAFHDSSNRFSYQYN